MSQQMPPYMWGAINGGYQTLEKLSRILTKVFRITVMPYAHNGISNHWQLDSLFNHLWVSWCFRSPATQQCVQSLVEANNKQHNKALVTGPLWGESTMTGGLPSQRASNAEIISIPRSQHVPPTTYGNWIMGRRCIYVTQWYCVLCILNFFFHKDVNISYDNTDNCSNENISIFDNF